MSRISEALVAKRELPAVPKMDTEEEMPANGDEVYTLRPLAREYMIARVLKTQITPFRYVEDEVTDTAFEG